MAGLTEALGIVALVVYLDLIGFDRHAGAAGNISHGIHVPGTYLERSHAVIAAIEANRIARRVGGLVGKHRGAQAEHQHQRKGESRDFSELFHLLSTPCFFL